MPSNNGYNKAFLLSYKKKWQMTNNDAYDKDSNVNLQTYIPPSLSREEKEDLKKRIMQTLAS